MYLNKEARKNLPPTEFPVSQITARVASPDEGMAVCGWRGNIYWFTYLNYANDGYGKFWMR